MKRHLGQQIVSLREKGKLVRKHCALAQHAWSFGHPRLRQDVSLYVHREHVMFKCKSQGLSKGFSSSRNGVKNVYSSMRIPGPSFSTYSSHSGTILTHIDGGEDNMIQTEVTDNVLQKLKDASVEDAAILFFDSCTVKGKAFDLNAGSLLKTILHKLHHNPQASESFLKAVQEICNETKPSKFSGVEELGGTDATYNWLHPNRDHYHLVLDSWRNFQPPSAKRVQALLQYMKDHAEMDWDIKSCNMVLETWAEKENAEQAQAFFDRAVRKQVSLDLNSFLYVFRAWSRSKSAKAFQRADDLLRLMESFPNVKPNAECYLRTIECWAKSKRKGSEQRIEDLFCTLKGFDTGSDPQILQQAAWNLLQVYHSIGNAHRAEEILLKCLGDFESGKTEASPTPDMCLSVLSTWSKSLSTRRAHRSEKLLDLMTKNPNLPNPDAACFTAVLNCISGSKKQGSAEKAEALLRRMENDENITPSMVSLTYVLIAWARSDASDALSHSERIFREILDRKMEPNRFVYAGLITAWGRSNELDAIINVEQYFQCIKNSSSTKPTAVEYTAVIQAYANYVSKNVEKSRESVERAEELLDEMLSSEDKKLRPNMLTYGAVLKTIAAARRIPDRRERAESVLRKIVSQNVEITPYIRNLAQKCNTRKVAQ